MSALDAVQWLISTGALNSLADQLGDRIRTDLRDQFAIAALTGVINDHVAKANQFGGEVDRMSIAESAYAIADALLKERSRHPKEQT